MDRSVSVKSNPQSVLRELAADYPLFYLNPDRDTQETYRSVVLRGTEPTKKRLDHYVGDPFDRLETADTPAGPVRVLTLGDRRDFELVIRGLLAAKKGPLTPVPRSQGAAMLTVFNWRRINTHLAAFPREERSAEFRRFTSVSENYLDMLVVLSRGSYSHVDAAAVGHSEDEWLALSDTIRRYHELTHVICRRLYPKDVDPVRDELIADAVGLYAAYGSFDPEKERLFLGLREGRYVGGRLENYIENPEEQAAAVDDVLERMSALIAEHAGAEPFTLIPLLMQGGWRFSS